LTVAGHRAVDDVRPHGAHVGVRETVTGEIADPEVLDQHGTACGEITHQSLAARLREIHRDRFLPAVHRQVVRRLAGLMSRAVAEPGRSPAARLVAGLRALDLDDLGAEVGEALGGPRTREGAGEVEDADVLERTRHGVSWLEGRGAGGPRSRRHTIHGPEPGRAA